MTPEKPSPEDSYRDALEAALEGYRNKVPEAMARNAGAGFDPASSDISLEFMGIALLVSADGERIRRESDGDEPGVMEKILVLHYLSTASGEPPAGREMAFREIPGGAFYNATFHSHTVVDLVKAFGNDEDLFKSAANSLGAREVEGSGIRMRFEALPRVPVILSYWPGEEEMPAGAQVLFDASVTGYLPLEDIAVLGESLVHRVVEAGGRGGGVSLYEYGA